MASSGSPISVALTLNAASDSNPVDIAQGDRSTG